MTDEITTLAGISRHWAREAPDRMALTAGDRTWTFGELDTEARPRRPGPADQLGVGAGSRVAYLDKNTPEYFTHLFGGAKLNAVSVAVNWRLAPPEMEYIIDNADGDGAVHRRGVPRPPRSDERCRQVQQVIVIGDAGRLRSQSPTPTGSRPFEPIDPDVADRRRRHLLPALHVGDDRAPEGRRTHQRQPARDDGHRPRRVAVRRRRR